MFSSGRGKSDAEGYNTIITLLKNRNKHFESPPRKLSYMCK